MMRKIFTLMVLCMGLGLATFGGVSAPADITMANGTAATWNIRVYANENYTCSVTGLATYSETSFMFVTNGSMAAHDITASRLIEGPVSTSILCNTGTGLIGVNVGATSTTTIHTQIVTPCVPSWTCGTWGSCLANGTQLRTCTDINSCDKLDGRPVLYQSCIPPVTYVCGNGICEATETASGCPSDCYVAPNPGPGQQGGTRGPTVIAPQTPAPVLNNSKPVMVPSVPSLPSVTQQEPAIQNTTESGLSGAATSGGFDVGGTMLIIGIFAAIGLIGWFIYTEYA